MLVGGGELHDTFDSLVRTERPLSRGIQRFTGITQAMVDSAPPAREVLEELGELLPGPGDGGPLGDLRSARPAPAFERCGLSGPTRRCCARSSSPAASRRCPAPRWRRWPTRSASRSPRCTAPCADALTCARVLCALFPRLCANASTVGEALEALKSRRRARKTEPAERIRRPSGPTCRRCRTTRASTSSATAAGDRSTSASRCRCARAPGPTSAPPPAGPARPRSSTTGPPTRSWARWCSRTG